MATKKASKRILNWPQESREAAQLVISRYGEPDEVTETQLTWHNPGPWKRIVAEFDGSVVVEGTAGEVSAVP